MATEAIDQNQSTNSSSMSNSPIDDGSIPYYLHRSDNPGLIIVSLPLYCSMMIALSMKNKLGFIHGSITRPKGNDDLLKYWTRKNNIVISWILNSVSKEILACIIYDDSAHEI